MIKTSTPRTATSPSEGSRKSEPRERTINFLKQFARAYVAPLKSATPGVVLN